jgi:hypothetical protein
MPSVSFHSGIFGHKANSIESVHNIQNVGRSQFRPKFIIAAEEYLKEVNSFGAMELVQ